MDHRPWTITVFNGQWKGDGRQGSGIRGQGTAEGSVYDSLDYNQAEHQPAHRNLETAAPETARCITILRNRSYLGRFSEREFAQLVTRARPLEWSIILNNLRGNCRSARRSRLLPSDFSSTDPTRISPFGDEVAAFSAARRSAKPGTNAFISPRSFCCGCAALRCCGDCVTWPPVELADLGSVTKHFESKGRERFDHEQNQPNATCGPGT